jgi:hypothetical protein
MRIAFILSFIAVAITAGSAQSVWSIELQGGDVFNVPLPLSIRQDGYPKIQMIARFRTEAFTPPVYWDCRLAHWSRQRAWELEVIHQKLYLQNTTTEVQKFNISHGFNLLIVNRCFQTGKFRWRSGAGIILAHPESNIRGLTFGDSTDDFDAGYFVSGPVAHVALGRPIYFRRRGYAHIEAKTSLAWSSIKIADGYARVFNLAFHVVVGVGFEFVKRRS